MRVALMVLRIPALLGLLLAMAQRQGDVAPAFSRGDFDEAARPWMWLVVLAGVFITLALMGRGTRQSRVALSIEGLCAAGVGIVPPFWWVAQFGTGSLLSQAFGAVNLLTFVHPLAIAWLGIVIAAAIHQLRTNHHAPQSAEGHRQQGP